MMKKNLVIVLGTILILTFQMKLLAQEKSASPSSSEEKQIIELKEKIASKVAQLQKENTQARSGYITEIKDSFISLQDQKNDLYQIKLDPVITKYYQIVDTSQKEIEKKDLAKDQYVIVDGLINGNQIEANAIFVDENFLINAGQITEINKNDYSIKVLTLEKEGLTLDIETYTKKFLLNIKTLKLETIGFSKIKEGDTVHFVIKKQGRKPIDRASALRLIIIPQEFFIKQ